MDNSEAIVIILPAVTEQPVHNAASFVECVVRHEELNLRADERP